jgi:CysZ protein
MQQSQPKSGFGYFLYGIELTMKPGIRGFVLLPLLANVLLVGSALIYLFSHLDGWIETWMASLPSYLSWLSWVLWPVLVITILGVFSYFFSTLANFVAAPFNGLLAEKVERHLTNDPSLESSFVDVVKDIPRVLAREWRKLLYILPKAIGLFILLLIPAIGQTFGPLFWFLFTAWMLAVQYCDYPFDNHKIGFNEMRTDLKSQQFKCYSFGALVSVFTTIPILNLFIMPIAVCGATAMWVMEFKENHK